MSKFIVKGLSSDRSRKVFVCAGNLLELIETLKRKLQLPEGDYQVYQAKDGTIIDDEEVFQMLAQEARDAKGTLEVMMLTEYSAWTDASLDISPYSPNQSISRSSSELSSRDGTESMGGSITSSNETDSIDSPAARRRPTFDMSDVCAYLDDALEKLNSEHPPRNMLAVIKRAVREACHSIGRHMLRKLRDYRKETARALAKTVIDFDGGRYAKLFQVMIGNSVSDPGYKSFTQCIYAYVNNNKGPENTGRRRNRSSSSTNEDNEEFEDEFGLLPPPASKQDLYGCVAYDVPLPFGETSSTQEEKRLKIIELANPKSPEAETLMTSTCASQRIDINRGKPLKNHLPTIIRSWPLLLEKNHFIRHAQTLIGKDVEAVFTNNVSKHWKTIFDFIHQFSNAESMKVTVPSKVEAILSLIDNAMRQSISNRSIESKCVAIFPMIALYLDEKLDKLFTVLPVSITCYHAIMSS
ncbi:Cell death activator CIDE-A [Frankliniella fusca]|uniref:Cell death activator CIDE-A n=1 Tax=Frankliniella fusca TaxID=407009 RepID=A0AAE1LRS8_9NEOP|nr:Cell death activator CIDE-A [Frankliniella fusca]